MRISRTAKSVVVAALLAIAIATTIPAASRAQADGPNLTGLGTSLAVKDFAKSLAFYRDTLGFTVVSTLPQAEPHVFAWIQRGGVHIFLNDLATVKKDPVLKKRYEPGPGGIAMFVLMTGIDPFYESVKGKVQVTEPLETKSWGAREFTITDPDDYVLTFSQSAQQ